MTDDKKINWKCLFADEHRYTLCDNMSGLSIDAIYRENINTINYSEFITFEIAGEGFLGSTMSVDIRKMIIRSRKTLSIFRAENIIDLIEKPYDHQLKFKYSDIDVNNDFGINTGGYRYVCGTNVRHIINSVDTDTMSLNVTLFVEKHPSVCDAGINKEQFIEKHGAYCDADNFPLHTIRQPVQARIPLVYILEEPNAPIILQVSQKESTRLFFND